MAELRRSKVFGIGLQRTGTTSLYQALIQLGYKAAPDATPLMRGLDSSFLSKYDAFMDNPVPLFFQELYKKFPDSQFVLTTRKEEDWLKSVEWLFEKQLSHLNRELRKVADEIHFQFYGTSKFEPEVFAAKWKNYHQTVYTFFEDKPKQLLIMDIPKGDGWEPLCEFLKCELPQSEFPRLNPKR